jgi:hypothetical protein
MMHFYGLKFPLPPDAHNPSWGREYIFYGNKIPVIRPSLLKKQKTSRGGVFFALWGDY